MLSGALSLALVVSLPAVAPAQGAPAGLRVKTTVAASIVGGCAAFPPPPPPVTVAPNAEAASRQLVDEAQDAALQGDHAAARAAFAKAAALTPGNARIAYYLGRELEALQETTPAVEQYCRYMALSPAAPDADEVRGRIVRLTPATDQARFDEARVAFGSSVALLQRKQYEAADSVLGAVVRQLPNAPEPYFNRALARAARGERATAMQDFEKYLELAPQASDRAQVRGIMTRLPDRVYEPGSAFLSGLLVPGLGQMSTGRPVRGVVALGLAAGALIWGVTIREWVSVQQFTDPFGNPYIDTIPRSARSNLATGATIAGVIWAGSALEATMYARRSRSRAEALIAVGPPLIGGREVSIAVVGLPRRRMGLGVSIPLGGRPVEGRVEESGLMAPYVRR